jgi:hypothetical protein
MGTPHEPVSENAEPPFAVDVRDLTGSTYHVQVIPQFSASGPVILGTTSGPANHGVLGLLNRVLAKGPVKQQDSFVVKVSRDEPGGAIVDESEHGSMREARQAAKVLVQAIRDGRFEAN